jgi:cell division septation protein DedD
MKQCPNCNRIYTDDSLRFCLDDGAVLAAAYDSEVTQIISPTRLTGARTEILPADPYAPAVTVVRKTPWTNYAIIGLLALIAGGGLVWLITSRTTPNTNDNSAGKPSTTDNLNTAKPTSTPPNVGSSNSSNTDPKANANEQPARPVGDERWFVVIGTFAKSDRAAADMSVSGAKMAGYEAQVIDTDLYPGLSGGYLAVVRGPYTQANANMVVTKVREKFPDAYVKSGW